MEDFSVDIPGIDLDTIYDLYDDDMDIYLPVLRSFVPNAYSVMEKLQSVSADTLADYAIAVHGLKGICSNIGAVQVSKAALSLEHKAKSGDLDGVLAGNDALLNEARRLISNVESWLEKQAGETAKPKLPSPDKALLGRLYQCCKSFDMQGIDEIMEELQSADYNMDGSLIPWLREKFNESDFSTAAERLAEYQ